MWTIAHAGMTCPLFRQHGSRPTEIWLLGNESEAAIMQAHTSNLTLLVFVWFYGCQVSSDGLLVFPARSSSFGRSSGHTSSSNSRRHRRPDSRSTDPSGERCLSDLRSLFFSHALALFTHVLVGCLVRWDFPEDPLAWAVDDEFMQVRKQSFVV